MDISPTILVIPGVSALRKKLPPLDLGAFSLPECIASVSLRSIAIDLGHGAIAGTLTFNEVQFNGDATLVLGGGLKGAVRDASMVLTLDFTYSYASRSGSVWLQSMIGAAKSIGVYPTSTADPALRELTFEAGLTRLSARDVWYSFDDGGVFARSGDLIVESQEISAHAQKLQLSTEVSIVEPSMTIARANFRSRVDAPAAGAGMPMVAELHGVQASFTKLDLAEHADMKIDGVASGAGGALQADIITIDLADASVPALSMGLSVTYRSAKYEKAGVVIEVKPNENGENSLVVTAAADPLTNQYGFRAKVADASFANASYDVKIPLKNISLNHHRVVHQPRLPATHRTKTTTAVSDIAFLITGFSTKAWPGRRVDVPWNMTFTLLEALGKAGGLDFASATGWLSNAVGNPFDILGTATNLLTLGQVRIEEVTQFVETVDVRVKFEPEWGGDDQTLAFKVVGGIKGVGVRIRYSYPCPTWDNWGRRCDGEENPNTSIPKFELELGVRVKLDVEPADKRIRVASVSLFIPVDPSLPGLGDQWKPVFAVLQDIGQRILATIYGVDQIFAVVTEIVNAALPIKLPAQWDVSRMTVSRDSIIVDGERVWGIELALRFEEHLFA